ncbi:MAG: ClpXP protease specificity-enhancing factor [Methylotenera sp.]|jgi:stringent starvation protein B|uniref:ClpXP protease specificity-enhancing factor n=1 Tax=Methylotenera sp. TaxID=2051956 RepID=UPI002723BE90|nr:ClpXP protease specificity-enhancing factor [Methylotenera sp.]MDO9150327.1 ClpXP protease specificity-enhancing factor [Methylotenera sp.]
MSELIPTKPYMLRALHEWCVDNNLTPHLIIAVNAQTRVPMAYVKDGEIVLNVNYGATKDLHIDNDSVVFSARFGGVSQNIYVPMSAIRGIFARENGQGMFFEAESEQEDVELSKADVDAKVVENKEELIKSKKPILKIVK